MGGMSSKRSVVIALLLVSVNGVASFAADQPVPGVPAVTGRDRYHIESNTTERLVVVLNEQYALGDNDTRLDARRLALQTAKLRAAELAGTYIESDTQVTDNRISKDEIRTLSAAYMETRVVSERFEMDAVGKQQYILSIHAAIDKTIIRKRIESLLQNAEYRSQIEQLRGENTRLKSELDGLNLRLVKKQEPQRYQVLQDRSAVLDRIDTTTASVRKVFEEGTLYTLARKSQSQFDTAKDDISQNIWRYLERNVVVTVGAPEMKANRDGTADIHVKINWSVDEKPVQEVMDRYFHRSTKSLEGMVEPRKLSKAVISKYENETGLGKVTYSKELLEFLAAHPVMVEISAGNYKSLRPLATSISCFVSCQLLQSNNQGGWTDYAIRYHYDGDGIILAHDAKNAGGNPVILSRIPEEALKKITSISARVVVR